MKVYDTENIRNIAIIGHGASGKTTLTSAMLFAAAAINRLGRVDEGTTITDYDEEEIARKVSINCALAFCEWNKFKVNIVDTPGYPDFVHDTKACLRAVDAGVLLVNAVSGVEVQTQKLWDCAQDFQLPVLLVLSKLDRDNAGFERALTFVQEAFGRTVVPVQLPIGAEKDFKGVIDLISSKAYLFDKDNSGKFQEAPLPAGMEAETAAAREKLVELVAESSDELMEKFFAGGTLSQDEMMRGLISGVRQRTIHPVFCSAASHLIGTIPLMNAIIELLPSPNYRPARGINPKTKEAAERKGVSAEPYSAFVFKTIADPFAGRISLFRVYSGVIKSDSTIHNLMKEKNEKLGSVNVMQGKTPNPVTELRAGDIGAVTKLRETTTGDVLCDPSAPIVYEPVTHPEPAISFAIEPKSRGDEDKISHALARIVEEDAGIKYVREPETKELILSGMGQMHVEMTVAKMKRRYGVEVTLKLPRIPYRETIRKRAEAQGRHKKQTGGHGQYGDCWIKVEPLPRGADFQFEDEIFGGSIPKQYIPAVEKGIQESRLHGILAGYPTVDFRVTVFDGSYHDVDSSELAFKIAGSLAFKKAVEAADPVLLEPIMHVEVYGPDEFAGDIMGDLNSRRGRVQGIDAKGSTQIIKAQVPLSEMLNYAPALTSMTGGRAAYHMEYSHYDEVPTHLAQKIIENAKKAKEKEE
ncbi:MAG: elongation factor G [Acidobacteria bacterium]|nr:elongation factor G [Acidobacteriota bacterium]MBI3655579.1 elongation factor G [Acidobacteriota bacterium]